MLLANIPPSMCENEMAYEEFAEALEVSNKLFSTHFKWTIGLLWKRYKTGKQRSSDETFEATYAIT